MDYIRSDVWDSARHERVRSSPIAIFSTGDVLLAEDMLAYSGSRNGPAITIDHYGNFAVRDMDNSTLGHDVASSRGGDITLNGNDGSGSATIRDIRAWISGGNFTGGARHTVRIKNYINVSIRNIMAYGNNHSTPGYGRHAANVIVENVSGDVVVIGEIDLDADGKTSRQGSFEAQCGGTITLAELNMDKILFASLSSGSGRSMIEGELLNFDADGSGSGSLNDPVVTTQTALRTPAGQRLLYKVRDGANADLEGKTYRIANENGEAGTGGLLMPIPTRGTVLLFF